MMDPGYEKPKKTNKEIDEEDLLYEIEEYHDSDPLDKNQFKIFRNELKLFTLKYICKIIKVSDEHGEDIYPRLCELCIYRKKCQNISLTKNKGAYVRLLTMNDLHDMAVKGQCYFPDINAQKVIELKIKQLGIKKFPFLYHLVTHNSFPIYKKYIVLPEECYPIDSTSDIPLIPELTFDYGDIEPEREEKDNKKQKSFSITDTIDKVVNKIFNIKTPLWLILIAVFILTTSAIIISDQWIILKAFGILSISALCVLMATLIIDIP